MSEIDDLGALLYDLEDELKCLEADFAIAKSDEYITKIEGWIDEVYSDIITTRETLAKLEREQNV